MQQVASLMYWHYFLALETDLEQLSRYVEFTAENFTTYSIEMAHLLLASASEIDVVAKQLCKKLGVPAKAQNIEQYRQILRPTYPMIETMQIALPRHGLEFTPWQSWQHNQTPDWWADYNRVKHQRSEYFKNANLKNVLNTMSGLFVTLLFFYQDSTEHGYLVPIPKLFRAPAECVQQVHTMTGQTILSYKI